MIGNAASWSSVKSIFVTTLLCMRIIAVFVSICCRIAVHYDKNNAYSLYIL